MSEASAVPPAAPGPEPGFLSKIFGLYFGPRDAFVAILRKPAYWLPLLFFVAIQLAFMGLWLSKMDILEFLRNQAEGAGQPFQPPPPQAMGFVRGMFWVSGLVAGPIMLFVFGAVYLFIFRFFYASEVTFKQSMAILTHTTLATSLVTTPLMIAVFFLKGDWNLPPQEVLQANPSLFLEKDEVAKPLWALLSSLDLFMFWLLFLVAVGFAVATRRTTGSAFWGVASVWIVITLVKILVAFF
jgi:hypothetical protein